jgi:hypothetical protein
LIGTNYYIDWYKLLIVARTATSYVQVEFIIGNENEK